MLYENGALRVFRLVGDAYEVHATSAILPSLDLGLLVRFVVPGESQTRLVKAYLAALHA